MFRQPGSIEGLPDLRSTPRSIDPVEIGEHLKHFRDRKKVVRRPVFGHVADALEQGRSDFNALAEQFGGPLTWSQQPEQTVQRCRLACAIGAKQAIDLSPPKAESQACDRSHFSSPAVEKNLRDVRKFSD
jgi:hypothetical protein